MKNLIIICSISLLIFSCSILKKRGVSYEKISAKRILAKRVQNNGLLNVLILDYNRRYKSIYNVPYSYSSNTFYVMCEYKQNGIVKRRYFIPKKQYFINESMIKTFK